MGPVLSQLDTLPLQKRSSHHFNVPDPSVMCGHGDQFSTGCSMALFPALEYIIGRPATHKDGSRGRRAGRSDSVASCSCRYYEQTGGSLL